jgi:hypothetical protein
MARHLPRGSDIRSGDSPGGTTGQPGSFGPKAEREFPTDLTLPVLDGGEVVGIVSRRDLVESILHHDDVVQGR